MKGYGAETGLSYIIPPLAGAMAEGGRDVLCDTLCELNFMRTGGLCV